MWLRLRNVEGGKKFVLSSFWRIPDPYLLLENPRPLSPPRGPQTPFSSSGTPDFLSTFLGIDSLNWKRPWCWERLKAGGVGNNRGWDGWMASLTLWTWVWTSSGSWWWTGRPGVLQSMGLQRVGHDWPTELKWTEWAVGCFQIIAPQRLMLNNDTLDAMPFHHHDHTDNGDNTDCTYFFFNHCAAHGILCP